MVSVGGVGVCFHGRQPLVRRYPTIALTPEDVTAFWFVRRRRPRDLRGDDFFHAYMFPYFCADASAADLMLHAQMGRHIGGCYVDTSWVDFRGRFLRCLK